MQAKYMTFGLLGAISLAGMISTIGCGGGSRTNLAPGLGATKMSRLTRFDVDVQSGKVHISTADSKGRAILTGGAVSFTSSDLLSVGGDSGKRLVHIGVVNNSGEVTPTSMRLIVSNLVNSSTDPNLPANYVNVTTFAGNGTQATQDGYGTSSAEFQGPVEVTAGAGPFQNSFFVTDSAHSVIRKMELDGSVTTFAGTAGSSTFADGTGSVARFSGPQQSASDASGNLFVADYVNRRIRRITPQKQVTTIAGPATGTSPPAGNANGTGDAATFNLPTGLAISRDGTRIYVADYSNHNIRLIQYNGTGPQDKSTSYTVSTVAGPTTAPPITGAFQDGAGATAQFNNPTRLALRTDSSGTETLYVTDRSNARIRGIANPGFGSANVYTIAGNGTATTLDGAGSVAQFNNPYGLSLVSISDSQFILIASEATTGNSRIRMITYVPGSELTQSGNYKVVSLAGSTDSYAEGSGSAALFKHPYGVWSVATPGPSATVYVADYDNYRIRKLTLSSVLQSGGQGNSVSEAIRLMNWDSEVPHTSGATAAWVKNITPASDGPGYATDLQFYVPSGVGGFSFTAYVEADTNLANLPGSGSAYVTTLAGDGTSGDANGPGKLAEFSTPNAVAAVPASIQGLFSSPTRALILDKVNKAVRALDTSGNIRTLATGFTAGTNGPSGIVLAPDGSAFVTDTDGNTIKRVSVSGSITTIGTGAAGNANGSSGADATFRSPSGVTIDSGGAIFVTESLNPGSTWDIRRITLVGSDASLNTSYRVSTPLATTGTSLGAIAVDTDGRAFITSGTTVQVSARSAAGTFGAPTTYTSGLTGPLGVALDGAHNLYISDGNAIKRISPGGSPVTTIAGSTSGFVDGPAADPTTPAKFNAPVGLVVEAFGSVLVADTGNHAIRALQRQITEAHAASQ